MLCAEWPGSNSAVNVLLFSEDGKRLLCGGESLLVLPLWRKCSWESGDDERVRVYDTDSLQCEKTVHSDKWGQVMALSWVYVDYPVDQRSTSLCVGSGRGFVTMCPLFKDDKVCQSIVFES